MICIKLKTGSQLKVAMDWFEGAEVTNNVDTEVYKMVQRGVGKSAGAA